MARWGEEEQRQESRCVTDWMAALVVRRTESRDLYSRGEGVGEEEGEEVLEETMRRDSRVERARG